MKLIGNILRWIWRTFWGLIWLSMVLLACGLGLLFYFQQAAAPQMLQTLPQEVQLMVKGQSEVTTDTVNTADHGRWESNTATVYIETQNPTFVAAYETAIANWNATGAFTFVMTSDPNQADIIATEMNDGNTQAAGEANSTTNLLTNYYSSVTVCLNSFYLLNDQYGYDMDRIIHTAEHELGHAIGLDHEDSQTSVMESAGSNHGIQQADIDAVLALYSE
ncbi:matrixin family metalloprotease [Streptococcus suis]|uniref:M57 family metalloprotease n=1 Tax=Streptococcus suis TaxID=1307 RepID=UPI001DCD4629|nr:M57 family metalloprotease [Streptococcus suis]MBS7863151.1 matrixin family metalloprotease [Streptococcus suis]MBS7869267.1 matrixin family metalloprotease [Streptococcus suis]MBS7885164.1 matrixin family metalloprotease [Streptococcus suis]MBS7887071.1 matrixin family metalloprotease [Streptococcus suis]MBS7892970.1 matrixin family metalloprotease [Streptococcus suis]